MQNKPKQTQFKLEAKRRSLHLSFLESSNQGPIKACPELVEGANLRFIAENTEFAEKKDICVSYCSIKKYALYYISPRSLRTRRLMKNKANFKKIEFKLLLQFRVLNDIIWCVDTGSLWASVTRFLKSEYGGERYRPDGGKASCMSRTPVGLANHPAANFKWQLSVAHGCLI